MALGGARAQIVFEFGADYPAVFAQHLGADTMRPLRY
jgi:hypothetical protein